jgi:hypothetical protein
MNHLSFLIRVVTNLLNTLYCVHIISGPTKSIPPPLLGATDLTGPGPPYYQGFTITLSSMHFTWQDSSGWMISPTQRPLPDRTQRSQLTDFHASGEICTRKPSKWVAAEPRLGLHCHWDGQQ